MVVDGALADAEVGRDILARMPLHHELQYFPLARREAGDGVHSRIV